MQANKKYMHKVTGISFFFLLFVNFLPAPGKFYLTIQSVNPLPNNKLWAKLTKLRAFADNKLNVANIWISLFDRVENMVGTGENFSNQHFILFQRCFLPYQGKKHLPFW